MKHDVVRTRSGALAMRNPGVGEVMHPGVGPLVEAELLYVRQSRLEERLRAETALVVFDVGMGAGSNASAALSVSERVPTGRLQVVSFEHDLDGLRLALEHAADFGFDGARGEAGRQLLQRGQHQTARALWRLEHGDALPSLARQTAPADIVFWDPFSPRVNPQLWTIAAFQTLRGVAGPRCTLFTYSASTAVRVALLLAGWAVGVGDAIGDKASTTAAAVVPEDLARPLPRAWLARLSRPDAPLPLDAPADAARLAAAAPQFCP